MRENGTYWFVGLLLAAAAALSFVVIMTIDDTCPTWADGTVAERNEDGLCPKDPNGGPPPPLRHTLAPPPVGEADPFPPSEPDPVNPADQPGDPIDSITAPGAENKEPVVVDPDPTQPAEGDVDPGSIPAPPASSTRQFTEPDSELGEWVREPGCPEGSQSHGITVENDRDSLFSLRTSAVFGEDGRDKEILLTAEQGSISMVYEIDWVPGAAEGNPDAGSSQWSFWRHVPVYPHGQVWLENGRGFAAGDYLKVCIDRGDL